MGVDLFFTLSGFILAHFYLAGSSRRFGYGGFLRTGSRGLPMHLAALAAMLVLFAGATAMGAGGLAGRVQVSDLPAPSHVHAWGTTAAVGWNFPSWSISAEWAAYLLFPLVAGLALKARRWLGLFALGALALCIGSFWALSNLHAVLPWVGRDFSQMTAQIGALRILPSFLLGVHFTLRTHARGAEALGLADRRCQRRGVVAVTVWSVGGAGLVRAGGCCTGLAETSRHGVDAPMSGRVFVFLGAASYALYMIHLPIDIVWFNALERFGVTETSGWRCVLVRWWVCSLRARGFGFGDLWIEEPARNWIANSTSTPVVPERAEREPGTQGIVERGACGPWVPDHAFRLRLRASADKSRVRNDGV